MRHFNKFLLLVSALGFTTVLAAAARWETLRAINWVENPTNQTHAGRYGELGPYQFRSGTWRMHTKRPFRQAIQREAADEVAVQHYEWIKRTFEQAGVEPSVFNIALAWNCGVEAVVSGRAPGVSYNYAQRVTNLVESFKEQASRDAASPSVPTRPVPAPAVKFSITQRAPRFEIVLPPEPALPVVYTKPVSAPAAEPKIFFVATAAITPRLNLIASLD